MNQFRLNISKIYLIRLFMWMHFVAAVLVPFYTNWCHITFAQIMILNAWFMLWNFLFEIPTGTVADFVNRKSSIALGLSATFNPFSCGYYLFRVCSWTYDCRANLLDFEF